MARPVNYVAVMAYLTPLQKRRLDRLTKATRISGAALLREAIDDLLKKYRRKGDVI